jgi:hypothetical protein
MSAVIPSNRTPAAGLPDAGLPDGALRDAGPNVPDVGRRSAAAQVIEMSVHEFLASWRSPSCESELRHELRVSCDERAYLMPLDEGAVVPLEKPLAVQIRDISRHGVGIVHPEVLPYRHVLLRLDPTSGPVVRLVVRLKWCRFKKNGGYESGGPIVKVLDDKDEGNK